jgi:predicted nucleic acid-binding protein
MSNARPGTGWRFAARWQAAARLRRASGRRLRVPHAERALDKLIAATALIHDLIVVTRNVDDFSSTGVRLLNPFD